MLQLANVHTIHQAAPICIQVQKGQIIAHLSQSTDVKNGCILPFTDAIAFPGLINSHDHLDFNLFPALGNGLYDSYRQWGPTIQQRYKTEIDAVKQIPETLRAQWGIYKNLCNGITTVVNHGKKLSLAKGLPIRVLQDCYCLHSVGFDHNWQAALQRPFRGGRPFVIHCGEGIDEISQREIDELIQANRLQRELIGVHGVAMTVAQAKHFKALVWCPASNFFLLNKTAAVDLLQAATKILFGTDSTLTAPWNIWQHLRLARQQQQLTDDELLASLTSQAAAVWKLPAINHLQVGDRADIVVARAKALKGMDAFYATDPQDILLVLHQGQISLFDESLYHTLKEQKVNLTGYGALQIGEAIKYVKGPIQQLMQQIRHYHPAAPFFPDNTMAYENY